MSNLSPEPTLPDFIVFNTVAFQTVPFDILAHNAMMRHSEPLPLESWEVVIAKCIEKSWLRILNAAALQEISTCLVGVELVCDAEAIPRAGDIDFTPRGAEMYREILSNSDPWLKSYYLDAPAARIVSRTESHCEVECYMIATTSVTNPLSIIREGWANELARRPVVSTTQPEVVGAWCSRWWNQHPSGYRIKAVIGT